MVHHIGVFLNRYVPQKETHWSMASHCLVSFLNRKKKKQLTNASIRKMGLSGDLLGGFRGIAVKL